MNASPPRLDMADLPVTEALLRRAQAGDSRALFDLFERYRERVLRIARVRIGAQLTRRVDPEDIVQLTLETAWRHLDGFDPAQAPRLIDWLAVIAENRIRDEVRRWSAQKRHIARDLEIDRAGSSGSVSMSIPIPTEGETPSQCASAREAAEIYDRCLSQLSARHREVILLRQYADMSWEEVAARLGSPNAKAAVQLHMRATDALRERLARAGFDVGST